MRRRRCSAVWHFRSRSGNAVRCGQGVYVKERSTRLLGERRAGSWPGEPHLCGVRQAAQLSSGVREAIRRGGRDHDRLGPERAGRLGKRFEWRVLAEIRDAPASSPQGKAERDQPEVVLLAWSAGQQSTRPGAAIPTSREAEQPASEELAGEMLLAYRRFAPRPALTELAQVRQH